MTTLARVAKAKAAGWWVSLLWLQEGKPPKRLTTSTIAKRLQFCQANKTRNWGHVMFSDRKTVHFQVPRKPGEAHGMGKERAAKASIHPQPSHGIECVCWHHRVWSDQGAQSDWQAAK